MIYTVDMARQECVRELRRRARNYELAAICDLWDESLEAQAKATALLEAVEIVQTCFAGLAAEPKGE